MTEHATQEAGQANWDGAPMLLHGLRIQSIAVCAVILVVTAAGCRQLGTRSSTGTPSPNLLSEPVLLPSENSGPSIPDIPPAPPASARRSVTSPRLDHASGPRFGDLEFGEADRDSLISRTSNESDAGVELEADLTDPLPSPIASNEEPGLVPAPRDLEDDVAALKTIPSDSDKSIVQLDVIEFLVELEQTPAPVKALTVPESITAVPAPLSPVIATSTSNTHDAREMEAWPAHGLPHGIAINPGPKGTGNRVETYLTPVWNSGPQPTLPPWGSAYPWAGQNSDWGGRQFR